MKRLFDIPFTFIESVKIPENLQGDNKYDNLEESYDLDDKLKELRKSADFAMVTRKDGSVSVRGKENLNGGRCDCCGESLSENPIVEMKFYKIEGR